MPIVDGGRRALALILVAWIAVGLVLSLEAGRLEGKLVYSDERYLPDDLESVRASREAEARAGVPAGPVLVVVLEETGFERLNATARLLGEALSGMGYNVTVSNAATVYWGILQNYTRSMEEAKRDFNSTLDEMIPVYEELRNLWSFVVNVSSLANAAYGAADAYLSAFCETGNASLAYMSALEHASPLLGDGAAALASELNSTVPGAHDCTDARALASEVVARFVDGLQGVPGEARSILLGLGLDNYTNRTLIALEASSALGFNLSPTMAAILGGEGPEAAFASLLGPGMEWLEDYLPRCLYEPEWRNRSLVRFQEWFLQTHPPPRYPAALAMLGRHVYDSLLSPVAGYSATYIRFHGESLSGAQAAVVVSTVNETLARLGYEPLYAGSVALLAANYESVGESVSRIDMVTVAAAALILAAALGGLGAPLTVLAAVAIAVAATLGLMSLLAGYVGFHYIARLVVMPIAVGLTVDYTVYTLFRYVEEKFRGHRRPLLATWRGSSRALMVGGVSVVLGFLAYNAGDTGYMDNVGTALALAAAVALAVSLTFSPSMLGLFERIVFWPRPPRHRESRRLGRIASRAYRRPLPYLAGALLVLAAAVAVLYATPPGTSSLGYLVPEDSYAMEGQRLYDTVFPPSALDTLVIIHAPTADRGDVLEALRDAGVPVDWYESPGPCVLVVGVDAPVYSGEAIEYARYAREALGARWPGTLVGGEAALRMDLVSAIEGDFYNRILPVIVAVILAYMALVLGSMTMPARLLATVAWSAITALGLATLLLPGEEGLYWLVPVEVAGIALALGIDYDVFIIGRVAEALQEGLDEEEAVAGAVSSTGFSVTVCGLVLGTSFLTLLLAPQLYLRQIGLAIGLSVLLDTFVVRPVLVPAMLGVLGRWNWWPGRGLLYRIRVSGGSRP